MPFKLIKGQFAPRLGRPDGDSVPFIPNDLSVSALLSRKTALATLLITVLASGIAVAQQTNLYVVRDTVTDCLNVRPTHDTSAEPIACLPAGTEVSVTGSVPYWREITFGDNQTGWVAKKYIEPRTTPAPAGQDAPIPADAWLEVHFVDVGQGDGIWIHTHDDGVDGNGRFEGLNIVIDGGPYSSDLNNRMRPYLENRAHHGAIIDALILTHPHSDHYYGAETISRHFQIRDYYDPNFPSTLTTYEAFLDAIRGTAETPARAERVHLGRDNFGNLNWGSELTVQVLYAWPGDGQGLGSGNTRVNNASIVLRLEYGNHSFLFMGDAEGKDRDDPPDQPRYVEQILLNSVAPEDLDATVLKIAHHGSETSSTNPFIQAVDPEIVVVQSGRRSFGGTFIPDASTLQRYCCHNPNILIYRTDQNDEADGLTGVGAADGDHIVIRTNGTNIEVQALEGAQPFNITSCQPACSN
ncbi:MBL fold metallo-hydrolase [Acidobacteria bacterium AH-259-A15]|nr:MBL fold metallo-hydrolase [Acidobacteria bacterium AH-259-A15]